MHDTPPRQPIALTLEQFDLLTLEERKRYLDQVQEHLRNEFKAVAATVRKVKNSYPGSLHEGIDVAKVLEAEYAKQRKP